MDRLELSRETMMNKILVWDIPARLVHWAFAAPLTVAAAIGFLVDKEHYRSVITTTIETTTAEATDATLRRRDDNR